MPVGRKLPTNNDGAFNFVFEVGKRYAFFDASSRCAHGLNGVPLPLTTLRYVGKIDCAHKMGMHVFQESYGTFKETFIPAQLLDYRIEAVQD